MNQRAHRATQTRRSRPPTGAYSASDRDARARTAARRRVLTSPGSFADLSKVLWDSSRRAALRRGLVLASGLIIVTGAVASIQLLLNRSDAARRAQTDVALLDQRAVGAAAIELVLHVSPPAVLLLTPTLNSTEADLVSFANQLRPMIDVSERVKLAAALRSYLATLHSEYNGAAAQRQLASPLTSNAYVEYLQLHSELATITTKLQRLAATARFEATAGTGAILIACMAAVALLGMRFQSERDRARRYAREATTDSLTGLGNRRAFQELLAARLLAGPMALVLVDLDGLKRTNDALGHQAGDARIISLAHALRDACEEPSRAFRMGGDEFAVILPGTFAAAGLIRAVRSSVDPTRAGPAQVAAGVAERAEGDTPATLIRRADAALIRAKRSAAGMAVWSAELAEETVPEDEPRYNAIADVLAHAIGTRDRTVQSHAQVVAALAHGIALSLGLDAHAATKVRIAGLLHDVGKLGIPDAILHKRSALTAIEWRLMRTYPQLGAALARGAGLPDDVAATIGHHHEHWDGTGYPDHLRGEQIPIGARILLVADAYEAMTAGRPYRQPVTAAAAIAELDRAAGAQFDSACVAALKRALTTDAIRLIAVAN